MKESKPKPEQDEKTGRFVSGNIGGGRSIGARNKLGEELLQTLYADFKLHGPSVVEKVRETDPSTYLRVVAGILPKELKIENSIHLNDADLDARIRRLLALTGLDGRAGRIIDGTVEPERQEAAH